MIKTTTDIDFGTDDVVVPMTVTNNFETDPKSTMVAVGNALADKMMVNVPKTANPPGKCDETLAVEGVKEFPTKLPEDVVWTYGVLGTEGHDPGNDHGMLTEKSVA